MKLQHNPPLYRGDKLIREECWTFHAVCYRNDRERRLLRATYKSREAAEAALHDSDTSASHGTVDRAL